MSDECQSIKIIAQFQVYVWVLDDVGGLSGLKWRVCTESQQSVRPRSLVLNSKMPENTV